MNTTRQDLTTATVGQGASVHYTPGDYASTLCGAEGRGVRQSRVRATDAAVTCKRCIALAPAPESTPEAPETKAPRTWDATTAETHTCAGECGETKPAKAFPTTGTAGLRGVVCRSCRDTARAEAKA